MIEVTTFADAHVAVFGLGRSGLATARALMAGGAEVCAWDDSPDRRDEAAEAGVSLADLYSIDWKNMAALILSPGVPLTTRNLIGWFVWPGQNPVKSLVMLNFSPVKLCLTRLPRLPAPTANQQRRR